jgi:hypothetical protein
VETIAAFSLGVFSSLVAAPIIYFASQAYQGRNRGQTTFSSEGEGFRSYILRLVRRGHYEICKT